MSLDSIELESGPNPTATMIILHGLGRRREMTSCRSPKSSTLRASARCASSFRTRRRGPSRSPAGYVMRAWYDILGTDLVQREDEAGLRQSQARIEALIARRTHARRAGRAHRAGRFLAGLRDDADDGMTRHPERLAGLVAMSGYLPLAATLDAERHAANHDVPIFLAHGLSDPMIPMARSAVTRECLARLGYPLEIHDYPMGHSVCAQEIADLNRWLLRVLA